MWLFHFDFQQKKKIPCIEKLIIFVVDFHPNLLHRLLIENVVEYFVVIHHMVVLALLLLYIAFALLMFLILIVHDSVQLYLKYHLMMVLLLLKLILENVHLMKHQFLHKENEDVNEVFHNEDY
jgi:hypothetical protein